MNQKKSILREYKGSLAKAIVRNSILLNGLNDAFCKIHPWLAQKASVCEVSAGALLNKALSVHRKKLVNFCMIFVLLMQSKSGTEPFFCDASYTLMYPTPPLTYYPTPPPPPPPPIPTTTPTPPLTYYHGHPHAAFLEGWGQDRVSGRHLTAKYYYGGVVRFWPIQRGGGGGGGGGGGAHVPSNTEYFNISLEVGGPPWGRPWPTTPTPPLTYYYPTPPLTYYYPTPPLTYYYPYSSPYLLFPWCME